MSITPKGIINHQITEKEFDLLKYLSPELYIKSSIERFTEWSSSFDPGHPDWGFRVMVQKNLAKLVASEVDVLCERKEKISIIFVGASLGSISTYFHLGELAKKVDLEDVDITILDLILEPLKKTINGDFEFKEKAEEDCGYKRWFSRTDYKSKLKKSSFIAADASDDLEIGEFDIVISPYLQHHMNIYGKEGACKQLEKMSKAGGLIAVGDLTFEYLEFVGWLSNHECESVPYSIESFIELTEHMSFFEKSKSIAQFKGKNHYAFLMQKK